MSSSANVSAIRSVEGFNMVLEATVIIIDNSEYMRNGDYNPTRFAAQLDAIYMIYNAKIQSNPENTVGVLSMGGDGPEVLATPTGDLGKIISAVHGVQVCGSIHLSTAIQVAALALKHRQNKVQRQRIVAFVGSPVKEDAKSLVKLAKKMKKNSVAVDFINFGQEADNSDLLDKFLEGVNSGGNSHLVTVPPGPHLLSDMIMSSPILNESGDLDDVDGSGGGNGGSGGQFEFGVDPSVDPELALALRMSLEDERARQERERLEAERAQGQGEPKEQESQEPQEQEPQEQEPQEEKKDDDHPMENAN